MHWIDENSETWLAIKERLKFRSEYILSKLAHPDTTWDEVLSLRGAYQEVLEVLSIPNEAIVPEDDV